MSRMGRDDVVMHTHVLIEGRVQAHKEGWRLRLRQHALLQPHARKVRVLSRHRHRHVGREAPLMLTWHMRWFACATAALGRQTCPLTSTTVAALMHLTAYSARVRACSARYTSVVSIATVIHTNEGDRHTIAVIHEDLQTHNTATARARRTFAKDPWPITFKN